MQKIFFLFLFTLSGYGSLIAQVWQGTIVYERRIDVHRHMQDEQMKAMIPQWQITSYELLFKDSISIFRTVPKEEAPDPFENNSSGGVHIIVGGPGDNGVLYKNYNSNRLLDEVSLDDKQYIISDTLPRQPWKLSDDTATVLHHLCRKAMMTTSRGTAMIAWYCTDIPLPLGPDRFANLPGAVLKVDIDNGGMVYTATEIRAAVNGKDLKAPTKGQVVTQAEYEKKMNEMIGPADSHGRRTFTKKM